MRDMITRIREALGSIIISIVGQGFTQAFTQAFGQDFSMQLQPARVRSGGVRWKR